MNNPIWLMTSAFPKLTFAQVVKRAKAVGAQGLELCVFRRDGSRQDHVATHLNYETFTLEDARRVLETANKEGLRFSVGAYDNLLGGDPAVCEANRNHILKLIRIAHLLGGDANDVCVGTFVGYNHELGKEDGGFAKNLECYARVFRPIVRYAEDLGVTLTYENCPMEGWRPASTPTTYNNLPCTLAARKLMYALIPSPAHGETYDPSHDAWQHIDPVDVVRNTDLNRLRRVHIKGTRNRTNSLAAIQWGRLYPMQQVDAKLAKRAGVCQPASEWDRHHYDPKLPGFGGSDSIDWFAFLKTLMELGFDRPFVIENEADNSSHTGNAAATLQGFTATVMALAPAVWPLDAEKGWCFNAKRLRPLKSAPKKDVPVVTMQDLM
ncbi:MAG TPA: sugar phosphate isomerase/epimerase [Kiritimatiellia bacterium]|nr:sugar phosphate isomerase/epimerase [Kiritimatiellia bacterium]HRU19335.1 sugar phosphate isomerase/epimerase [Kiritimatiellia bacterium]